jgi:hypothetical protein
METPANTTAKDISKYFANEMGFIIVIDNEHASFNATSRQFAKKRSKVIGIVDRDVYYRLKVLVYAINHQRNSSLRQRMDSAPNTTAKDISKYFANEMGFIIVIDN